MDLGFLVDYLLIMFVELKMCVDFEMIATPFSTGYLNQWSVQVKHAVETWTH